MIVELVEMGAAFVQMVVAVSVGLNAESAGQAAVEPAPECVLQLAVISALEYPVELRQTSTAVELAAASDDASTEPILDHRLKCVLQLHHTKYYNSQVYFFYIMH